MARHFSQNVTLVTTYLAGFSNSVNGATIEDIMAAAGISRSTAYRVLKATPAIKKTDAYSKNVKYYLDHEELALALSKPPAPVEKRKDKGVRLNVDPGLPKFLANVSVIKFIEDVRPWVLPDEEAMTILRLNFQRFSKAVENSYAFQSGSDSVSPTTVEEARQSIDAIQTFCVTVYLWLENLKVKPEYRSNEEFWTLFPKD